MQKRLFCNMIIVILIAAGITAVLSYMTAVTYVERQTESDLSDKIELFAADAQSSGSFPSAMEKYHQLFPEIRVSVIRAADGAVLYDTQGDAASFPLHQDRVEVEDAIKHGTGTAKRQSETTGQDFKYVAKKTTVDQTAYVIRFAVPADTVSAVGFSMVLFFVYALLISFVVASIVAYRYVRRITVPLTRLQDAATEISLGIYDHPIEISADQDLVNLAKGFEQMRKTISSTLNTLKTKNEQLDAIVNTMAGGLIAVDRDGMIILINQNAFTLLDLGEKKLTGKRLENFVRDDGFLSFLRGEAAQENLKLGSYFLRLNKTMLKDGQGMVILINDITKIVELETMRSDFVSNVSHELKTPLTSIIGFTDTLKNGALEQKEVAAKFLDIIDIESTRLLNLINDILELSHIETIRTDENQSAFPIDDTVAKVFALLEQKAQSKNVSLHYEKTGLTVFANQDRIKEVLINLVSNAVRYNVEGGSVICHISAQGRMVEIAVTDTGIGIAAKHLNRLFERFYRVDKGRSRESGGTGLGLSIVKHIAEMYQGNVAVTSTLGKGSTFTVLLPIHPE